ncbi:penicillin acylase family protein [Haematobacter massiliensis]|uniref:Penicillin acylase n=1 Tax=Haematobacter massiliensis TaxID=195105 RepID=A0A086XZ71_9RHOB|nr:penicillin acylase family protein [Haematobacter massiliensis]KFI27321.1 penicillin acylase [Haematobacter massiliensis]OWJ70740.1 penicillin acylase family protein [Haematobacter massiliensis]OWJ84802.1 penicillin acylase family protein [Haematobacter massiliensis]QBJ23768.1 penicillin acylase family protein [Haematobacter massiliensis]
MLIAFRWLVRILTALILVTAATLAGLYYVTSRSLPDYSASYRLSGVDQPMEIVRDTASVPHIFAKTDEDAFFGLGFVHAQDRLWQMTILRRTAQGRLSELFGARTVRTDEFIRRLDLYGLAQASFEEQDDPTKRALEAYSRGVNAWIETVNAQALGRGAPEFFLFPPEIAHWQPADSLAILKLMALQLTGQMEREVLRARTSLLMPADRVRDILPDVPGPGIAALPDYASIVPNVTPSYAALSGPESAFDPVHPQVFAGASNAWAAAPSRSASGGTLLANDPHLNFSAPTVWYLARLDLAGGGVIGGTIPGIPLVIVGRNADLGWALTSSYLDDQDLHIERLNPENPEEYLTPSGYKSFETRRAILSIKDAAPVTLTLRWTENGPVLPGSHYDLGTVTPPGHVMSLTSTALTPHDRTMTAGLRLMTARSVAAGLAAGELYTAPSQNLMLADSHGIAMQVIGAMPMRDPAHQTQGRMPSPGWIAQNRWQGIFPSAENPRFVEPEGGVLGNTNNKMIDAPFPRHVSFDWGDSQRIERWKRLMQTREVHTRESFIEAQLDTVSQGARTLLPLIGKDLWFTGEPAAEGTTERLRQKALNLLAEWNGEMNEHLPEPLIYAAWMRSLQEKLIRDELGPLADSFTHPDPLFMERVFRNIDGAGKWCDILQSSPVETCTDIARMALDDALLRLTERYGRNLESWRWGDIHQAAHDHPVLGNVPLLRYLVNIRQSTSGGDDTLMRGLTSGRGSNPYLNVHGAGYRGVYDFADPDSSVFITATGQSGHPLSRHYDDMGELWRRGEYIPMSLDPDLARAAAMGITRITPTP